MSLFGKTWNILQERSADKSLLETVFDAREIPDSLNFFKTPTLADLHDPFLFKDMQKAVDRIIEAIHARERIVIYGDYDVDGTSGSALLVHTLRFLCAQVSYRVPHRLNDGYGLHNKYVEELAEKNVAIIITVDCGISCIKEVDLANQLGVDVIITDHHTIPVKTPNPAQPEETELNPPKAFALIHPDLSPDYPFKKLAGSGVAFKLACALLKQTKNEDMIAKITDLASLGTVADCVPLIGENRMLLKLGLKQMHQTEWDGLQAILDSAGHKDAITSQTIGFQIGPRINAAGRMDTPMWAIQTLVSEGQQARDLSSKLTMLNELRRSATTQALEEAEQQVDPEDSLLIASGPWSKGIVGLLAGRIQDRNQKPCFILQDEGETMTGSARSMPGFHCVKALDQVKDILVGYGGHAQAAGFHLKAKDYPEFKKRLNAFAKEEFEENPLVIKQDVDCLLQGEEISLQTLRELSPLAPHGIGNPSPTFLIENFKIVSHRLVGGDKSHLSFQLQFNAPQASSQSRPPAPIRGIAFRWAEHLDAFLKAKQMLVQIDSQIWQGEERLQIRPLDIR
jgi:single-stranded-DNA-specific exonuclease